MYLKLIGSNFLFTEFLRYKIQVLEDKIQYIRDKIESLAICPLFPLFFKN